MVRLSRGTCERSEAAVTVRLFELGRWRITFDRMPMLTSGLTSSIRIFVVLVLGFLEMRYSALRSNSVRAVTIGPPANRRRIYLRANGMDTFTFYEVFIKGAYDDILPLCCSDTVLDLGANIGMASVYFDFCCPGVTIVAVEPERHNCELWRLNVTSRSAVLEEAAVSLSDGESVLALGGPTSHALVSDGSRRGLRVRTMTLTALAGRAQSPVTHIKCDIEGQESQIFVRPLPGVLDSVHKVAMEVHDHKAIRPINTSLRSQGFDLYEKAPDMPKLFVRGR
jgi:FkbM family methyltransferase